MLYHSRNVWPLLGILTVVLNPIFCTRFCVGQNCLYRTFWLTYAAINTLVGMDYQHVFTFIKTIDWAHFNTVSIFTFNTIFINDISHLSISQIHQNLPQLFIERVKPAAQAYASRVFLLHRYHDRPHKEVQLTFS